jgi:hypothetical protein
MLRAVARRSTRRRLAVLAGPVIVALAFGASGCSDDDLPDPARGRLRQPTGLAVTPDGDRLIVTGGNWDGAEADGTVMVLRLDELHEGLESGACEGAGDGDPALVCADSPLILDGATVRPGSGVGNVVIDRPAGEAGLLRLLVPTRTPASVVWIDLAAGRDARLQCGQDDEGRCDDVHRVQASPFDEEERLARDPARIALDQEGYRFAYVPHLLGAQLSLIALDRDDGPELVDIDAEFFRVEPEEMEELAGGFAVAQRACDPLDPPASTRDCTRPHLYATQRFFPGVRAFTVAPGLDLILPGGEIDVPALDPLAVDSRPYMADLAFEDPATGEDLLVVQTSPPALVRMDMRMEDGSPRARVIDTVALCANPNVLAVHRPEDAPWLALVSCFGDGELAVVDLATFRVIRTIPVGQGANEIAIDAARAQAYVANTEDDTISIVSLDRLRPEYLTAWARIGA